MARQVNKLTARAVAATKNPGYVSDGGNLWLQTSPSGTKSWVFRFTLNGRAREAGLGSVNDVPLADARERARAYRLLLAEGIDPIEHRAAMRAKNAAESASAISFAQATERFIAAREGEWRNAKHGQQWRNTLATYCEPINAMHVGLIDTPAVLRVLEADWATKTETLSRVRGRIEQILDWCTVRGYRKGENPARWRGHLDKLLSAPKKIKKSTHQPAIPWQSMPEFMVRLRAEQEGVAARCLELVALTGVRSGEARGMQWREIDKDGAVWVVPAERTKRNRQHRVPLSAQALALIEKLPKLAGSPLVFTSSRGGELSDMALTAVLRRMHDVKAIPCDTAGRAPTAHGLRSSLRDWAYEATAHPREIVEAALAHSNGDQTELAYKRGDALERRRTLLVEWAGFLDKQPAKVESISAARAEKKRKAAA